MVVGEFSQDAEVLVVGAGHAGRAAARAAAALGKQVILVDPQAEVVIPDVEVLTGSVRFVDKRSVQVTGEHVSRVRFTRAIICTGCRLGPADFRGLDATRAPRDRCDDSVLVTGSGPLALSTACRHAETGADVVLACPRSSLLPSFDPVLAGVVVDHLAGSQVDLLPDVEFAGATPESDSVRVVLGDGTVLGEFDWVIPAEPDGGLVETLELNNTAVEVDDQGWIQVDDVGATAEHRIRAAGGVTGRALEPAVARRHGQVVAAATCDADASWDPVAIPSYVDAPLPVSWCGLNEAAAESQGHDASSTGIGEGTQLVRLVHDRSSGLLLGAGGSGPAARIVAEATVIAIEMGATIEDLAAVISAETDGPSLADAARAAWKQPS